MGVREEALLAHENWKGKVEVVSRVKIRDGRDLSLAYTPGVAEPCLKIREDEDLSYVYTRRSNLVAVITDGSAVLGLGNIGAAAAMPVMEGKCCLFKEFADVDAFPLCLDTQDTDEVIRTVHLLSKNFGGINLEDIAAPRCFEIERRLREICDIPVFHDDQHGTAIVVGAAVLNALRVAGKKADGVRVVINGAGAAGTSIAMHLMRLGIKNIIMADRFGILSEDMELSPAYAELAKLTNREHMKGKLEDALRGADLFIGVSAPHVVTGDMVRSMAEKACVFPMANPVPEIMPEEAISAGAYVVGTGRSDYPNQINNVLAFPGIFRGALDVRARTINTEMELAATRAIAGLVTEEELGRDYILPKAFDKRVPCAVAEAVARAARESGQARI